MGKHRKQKTWRQVVAPVTAFAVTAAAATTAVVSGTSGSPPKPEAPPPVPLGKAQIESYVQPAAHVQKLLPAAFRARAQAPSSYTVQPGNTLWGIAAWICGAGDDYPALGAANGIADDNLIYAGQVLTHLVCRAATASTAAVVSQSSQDPPSDPSSAPAPQASSGGSFAGTLSCSGLEALWMAAGGAAGEAFMAAEIAQAESGGNQYAVSPTDDYGYWQINMPSWGPGMATFNPLGNAKAAVQISQDGTNWSPWTTYTSGAYEGRC